MGRVHLCRIDTAKDQHRLDQAGQRDDAGGYIRLLKEGGPQPDPSLFIKYIYLLFI